MVETGIGIGILGFVVGILVGMTGMGGGALTMPLLVFWIGIRPVVAVGTDLAFLAVLKLIGAWSHHRLGNVDWRLVRTLALGSVPGALVGLVILSFLSGVSTEYADAVITRLLGAMLIVLSVAMFARFLPAAKRVRDLLSARFGNHGLPAGRFSIAMGFVVGVLVSLTSVGGGTLIVGALILFYRMGGRQIVGTDIAHALILTSVAAAGHIGIGNVDLLLAGNLLIGAIPGVLIGSRLTVQIPERGMRAVLASVLLAAGLRLI